MRDLPTYYYLEHFYEFLKFVKGPCIALLSEAHLSWIEGFEALNKDQQCILVRSMNRKHAFVKLSSFDYAEINNTDTNLEFLQNTGWLRVLEPHEHLDFVLSLTKPELLALLKQYPNAAATPVKTSAKRDDIMRHAL